MCLEERGRLLRRNGRMGGTRIRGGRGLLSSLLFLAVAVGVNDVAVVGGMRVGHGWVIYHAQVCFQDYVPCQNYHLFHLALVPLGSSTEKLPQ